MNKSLLNGIYSCLLVAMSATTKHIYYDHLPDSKLLNEITIVYEVRNTSNMQAFEQPETIKFYSLDIKINAPQLSQLENQSIYIRDRLYKSLPVRYIRTLTEDQFYDDQLNVYTSFTRYEVQAD